MWKANKTALKTIQKFINLNRTVLKIVKYFLYFLDSYTCHRIVLSFLGKPKFKTKIAIEDLGLHASKLNITWLTISRWKKTKI